MSGRVGAWLLAGALLLHAGLGVDTLRRESATFDEGAHLPAGYTYLALGDHRLNPEQPPLVKVLAALPLLPLHPVVDTGHVSWTAARQWEFGRRFLYAWNDGDRLLLRGRLVVVVLSLALVAAVFLRARGLFGPAAGLLALLLATLSPELLAHGTLVTTDLAVALFVFLAVAAFDRATARRAPWALAGVGLASGAALASKFSGIVLVPVLVVLAVVAVIGAGPVDTAFFGTPRRLAAARARARHVALVLVAAAGLALLALWASYGFRSAISPDPEVRARLQEPLEAPSLKPWQRGLVAVADAGLVPEDYVRGLLFVARHSEHRETFLLGRISDDGFPWYFPVAFLLKTPLPLVLLTVLALARIPRLDRRTAAFLWVPVAVYLLLTATRGLQIGYRHLLPILPFLFVAAGEAGAWLLTWTRPTGALLVAGLGIWYAAGTLVNHPHHLAYFNEIAGGPAGGWHALVDSNVDWGQDLKRLKAWMDAHAVRHVKLSYFGSADPAYYGIDCERLPGYSAPHPPRITREWRPGDIVAVSVTHLQGVYVDPADRPMMARLRREKPIGRAGYSILIFRPEFAWPLPPGGRP
jgi:Dolichyl-phosphate-mannose-protein mannosyltransferase